MSPTERFGFGLHLLVSGLLYACAVAANVWLVHFLYNHDYLRAWFLPCLGLLLLPSVTLQLVSAVLLLLDKGDKLTVTSSAGLGLLHILQLGFAWRHVALFKEVDPKTKTRDVLYLNYLQLLFTFISLLPLLFVQVFVILFFEQRDWIIIVTSLVTLACSCYYITSHKSQCRKTDSPLITCPVPETAVKLVWRLGEIVSRLLSLVVFTTLYRYWIFLILGLRGITMLVCLCTSVLAMPLVNGTQTKVGKTLMATMLAYMYSFAFINFQSNSHVALRYAFYYTITCLENAVLLVVWYLHSDERTDIIGKNVILTTCVASFIVSMIALVIYQRCFSKIALFDSDTEHIYDSDECINCRLSVCSKHNIKLQRPFSAGWTTQYQKGTASGNYYKNILQDNYLDSDGVSHADMFNSSGEHCQIRDTDLESFRTNQNNQTIAVQGSGTYTHKRFFDSTSSIAPFTDTDSISSGSGVYEEDWRQKSSDTVLSQLSAIDALSLVSSRTQLLTDSWDTLLKQNDSCVNCSDRKHPKKIDILNSLIRKDLDTSFFSDGYTTDHTLESYQLPVTVLAKKKPERNNRDNVESAYSTASDSTDCTICAFMRQNPSTPEETRKAFKPPPQQLRTNTAVAEPKRRKRREYAGCNNAASRSRRHNLSTDQSGSERSYTHKYEKASSSRSRRSKPEANTVTTRSTSGRRIKTQRLALGQSNLDYMTVKSDLCLPSVHLSTKNLPQTQVSLKTKTHQDPSIPQANQLADIDKCSQRISEYSGKHLRETASDSGDSAFPRNTPISHGKCAVSRLTPLSVYLAATDEDNDGTSESSCEMII